MAKKRKIMVYTCRHLGDAICLASAVQQCRKEHPEISFRYKGDYGDIFGGLDLGEWDDNDGVETEIYSVQYRSHNTPDNRAQGGNLVDGMTASLARWLGVDITPPHVPSTMIDSVIENDVKKAHPEKYIVINTNCQSCSTIKGYPWWGEVLRQLVKAGHRPILIGGKDERDIKGDFGEIEGVEDLRGKTVYHELFALVKNASLVISPPSAVIHIAAATKTPSICITGAREPIGLTDYPLCYHIHTVCPAGHLYNKSRGCMHFRVPCERSVEIHGRVYPLCMACIPAENVIEVAGRIVGEKRRGRK